MYGLLGGFDPHFWPQFMEYVAERFRREIVDLVYVSSILTVLPKMPGNAGSNPASLRTLSSAVVQWEGNRLNFTGL